MRLNLIIIFSALSTVAHGSELDIESRTEAQTSTVYRRLNQKGFSTQSTSVDAYLVGGSQWRARYRGLQFEVKPELRGVLGQGAGLTTSDPGRASLRSPDRYLDLQSVFQSDREGEWILDWERLNASYSTESMEVYAGRRVVGLGVLKVFPVWNKFSRALPTATIPALLPSNDTAGIRYQKGKWALWAGGIAGKTGADEVIWGEVVWFSEWLELHVLGSWWWRSSVTGLAATKDLGGATLRAEWLGIGLFSQDDRTHAHQVGIGVEYALTDSLSGIVEGFTQTDGKKSKSDYKLSTASRFQALRAYGYAALQLQYKLTPIWTATGGTFLNAVDLSQYITLKIAHSLNDSTDLTFDLGMPLSHGREEFSSRTFSYPLGSELGVPAQFALGLKTTF